MRQPVTDPAIYKFILSHAGDFLSRDRELELVRQAQAGDTEARNELTTAHLRLIFAICKKYRTDHRVGLHDLLSEGIMGFWRGIRDFDESKGTRLATYAGHWVYNYMKSAEWNSRLIRVPWHAMGNPQLFQYAERALEVFMGGSVAEMGDRSFEPDEPMFGPDELDWLQQALRRLRCKNATDYKVMKWRMRGWSFMTIGEKLGITRERARQREQRAIAFLRAELEKDFASAAELPPPLSFAHWEDS